MKSIFSVMIFSLITLVGYFAFAARDVQSSACEVFIDKMVPVKVYHHDNQVTYTNVEVYLKISADVADQITGGGFYEQSVLGHAYGATVREWEALGLEKVARDYYKISLEVSADNNYVSKYSTSTSYVGNFYFDLKSGIRLWTKHGNFQFSNSTIGYIPVDIIWLNDGAYNLNSIPKTADIGGKVRSLFNPERCR